MTPTDRAPEPHWCWHCDDGRDDEECTCMDKPTPIPRTERAATDEELAAMWDHAAQHLGGTVGTTTAVFRSFYDQIIESRPQPRETAAGDTEQARIDSLLNADHVRRDGLQAGSVTGVATESPAKPIGDLGEQTGQPASPSPAAEGVDELAKLIVSMFPCRQCAGRGWFNDADPHTGDEVQVQCDCGRANAQVLHEVRQALAADRARREGLDEDSMLLDCMENSQSMFSLGRAGSAGPWQILTYMGMGDSLKDAEDKTLRGVLRDYFRAAIERIGREKP